MLVTPENTTISIITHNRPELLEVCLKSLKVFSPEWFGCVKVYDDNSSDPRVWDVIAKYEVPESHCLSCKEGHTARQKAAFSRWTAMAEFMQDSEKHYLIQSDSDVVFGPRFFDSLAFGYNISEFDALTAIHLNRTSKRGKPIIVEGITFYPLNRFAEALYLISKELLSKVSLEVCVLSPKGLVNEISRKRGYRGFQVGLNIQHLGANNCLISSHISCDSMLLKDEDGVPVQPLPGLTIDYEHLDFDLMLDYLDKVAD